MGQAASSPSSARRSSTPALQSASSTNINVQSRRRSSLWRRSLAPFTDPQYSSNTTTSEPEPARRRSSRRARSSSIDRLSRFLHSSLGDSPSAPEPEDQQHRRPSRLERARGSILLPGLHRFNRRDQDHSLSPSDSASRLDSTNFDHALNHALDFNLPDVSVPDLDLNFDDLTTTVSAGRPSTPRPTSRRSSLRLPNISSLRGERGARGLSGRRRRSPVGGTGGGVGGGVGEDNTALLSRLLSVAAAATAATLLEGNQQAIAEARSVAGDGDDGTFNSFLQSLESGRLASALRQAGQDTDENGGAPGSGNVPLNFFRMFRFGTATTPRGAQNASSSSENGANSANSPGEGSESEGGRMVPIIIVGIRSVNPGANTSNNDTGMPPFLDALSALPTAPFGPDPTGHDSIDNILRPAQNGTRFSHRRRASMGGVNNTSYDAQRHHRSPGPRSMAPASTEGSPGQSPSVDTPTSPPLTRVNSNPADGPTVPRPALLRPNLGYSARRDSIIRTTTTTTLETTTEDAPLPVRQRPRRRRLSESDYTSGSSYASRRNGIVEPDNAPAENTRSWIIYVLGGSYPENHPILTTPSLFTDSPTYEDMMLLAALLGPAKPPVASEQDVADAPGIFKIEAVPLNELGGNLVAVATDGEDRISIAPEQRCLVCLCDFELDEQARRLNKCSHLFHKVCIDEVSLT